MNEFIKYVVANGVIHPLFLRIDGLYADSSGTIWALSESKTSADVIDRCGVGDLSLSPNHPLTAARKVHDFMYSSPAYQVFHTRKEADEELERLANLVDFGRYSFWAKPLKWLSRLFGGKFWENNKTR